MNLNGDPSRRVKELRDSTDNRGVRGDSNSDAGSNYEGDYIKMVSGSYFFRSLPQIKKRVSKADCEERDGHGKVLFEQDRGQKSDYKEC